MFDMEFRYYLHEQHIEIIFVDNSGNGFGYKGLFLKKEEYKNDKDKIYDKIIKEFDLEDLLDEELSSGIYFMSHRIVEELKKEDKENETINN